LNGDVPVSNTDIPRVLADTYQRSIRINYKIIQSNVSWKEKMKGKTMRPCCENSIEMYMIEFKI